MNGISRDRAKATNKKATRSVSTAANKQANKALRRQQTTKETAAVLYPKATTRIGRVACWNTGSINSSSENRNVRRRRRH